MRKGWEYKRWKEVLTIINGKNQSAVVDENGEYPIYGSGGIMGYANNWLCPGNCVIIGRKGNINKPIFVETKFWNVDTAFGLNANKEYLLPKFLYYFCLDYNFERHNKAVTIPSLTKADLLKIDIPLPPKSTQLAIVSELDKINELIRLKKEQLKDFDNLAQNIFYEMFGDPVENEKGWTIQHLGDLCDKISNGYNAKLEENTYKSEGIMYFRCQNVWRNHFDYSDLVYIDENTNQKMKSSSLKHNDFLITKIGRINTENSSLGRVSLYEGEDDKANLSGNLCFARLKQGAAVHKFILYILISNQFRNYIRRTTVGGIDKRALNVRQICSFPIISPPLPLQHLFAHRIEQIEHQKSEVQKAITNLETLLASRMQYWFE